MISKKIVKILKEGGIGVLPTDTIYGLVGTALNPQTVERIYKVRKRNPKKPFIILIQSIKDLEKFNVHPEDKQEKEILAKYWPGKVSIILPCQDQRFKYLHRGTQTLAFRLPDEKNLVQLIKQTGPLVAPSANPEGLPPATTIEEAKNYFGDNVDFYVDAGELNLPPSTLIALEKGKVVVKREGAVRIES
jgi:L-threonylcarbamoyladenylate synthase